VDEKNFPTPSRTLASEVVCVVLLLALGFVLLPLLRRLVVAV